MYTCVPALALGGEESVENLKKVKKVKMRDQLLPLSRYTGPRWRFPLARRARRGLCEVPATVYRSRPEDYTEAGVLKAAAQAALVIR